MNKFTLRHLIGLFLMLITCVGNMFSQSIVNFGSDLYSTKYYESMNASNPPSGAWYAVDYDDSNWKSYTNPINFPEYDAFWVRRTFFIIDDPANHSFQLQFAHDNDAVIYINGHILHDCQGGNVCGRYNYVDIPNIYLAEGINVLAAYVLDGGGEQYLECFINTTDGSDIIADLPKNPMLLISESSLYLYTVEGHTDYTLSAQMITPTGKVDTEISWTSSNPEVVSVDNGQLVALSAGNSVVTATTTYNGSLFSKECEVEVREINPMSKIVTVEEPGTLGSLLTDEEKDNIDNLTIFGKLDGSDIQVLRYMAGRNERGNRTPGTLAELNIYNVEFVNGNNGSFKVSNDYTGYIEAGKLPNALFRNCVALNSIILPKNISRIGSEAFRECTNLETIVIPDEVSVIEGSVFSGCTNLKSIEIPASVISMGGSIFENCKRLENIVFAEGINLTSIPDWTFGYGNKIKAITIPASVTSIGYYAFYDNNNLENVIFEDGSQLVEIKGQSFYSCDNLQSINIPEGCLEIGNESFAGCYKLSRVTLPVSVASIGDGAFRYCNLLTDFEIPENSKLSSIGAYAFEGTNLSSFYIPKGLISIDDVFSNTTNLQTLTVHPDNKYYESVGGIVYSKRDKSALLVPKSIDGFLSFPDYVTSIPENLLQGCSRLKGIILHSGITSIGNNAFSGCAGLQTLMLLSSTPTTVSDLSLSGINKSVVTLVVPQGSSDAYITADGWNTFENIVEASEQPTILLSANNVIIYDVNYESARKAAVSATVITKDGISSIPVSWSTSNANIATVNDGIVEYAGEGTATITASVTVGEYTSTSTCIVTSVGMSSGKMVYVDKAGNLSSLLTDEEKDDLTHLIVMGELNNDDIRVLRYMAGVDEYGGLTVGSLEVLDMGKARIVSGGENGYYYRDNYWRVVGDNYFGELIFSSCNSLKKVVLPSSLTGLGYYAFYGCTNLEEVVLPDGLISIDHQAFAYCRKLSKVNIPSSVTNMSSWIFYGCTSLKTIDLSSMTGMNIIPDNMFRESGLTSVRIPANITNIQNEAFGGTPLKSLEFEDGSKLTSISDGAFQSTKLQSITIPASTTRLGNNAFNDCRHLSEVLYEENSKLSSIGENVFNGCPLQTFIIPKKLISMGTQDFSDSLKQIVVEEGNKFFEIVDGVLYSTSDNSLVYVPKNKTSVYLPNYVTSIKNGALRYHHNLKTLVLTATIADLGESPFCDSYNLTEIYCMNPTPPAVNNLTNGWGGKIHIPSGCKKAYEDANWESWLLEERSYSNSVVISASSLTLYDAHGGNSADLSSEVFSNNGPVQYSSVIWTSSDYNVVTVDSTGHIRYAGPGTAKITASTTLDETVYTAECNVTSIAVNDPDNAYYLTGNGNLRSLIGEDNKYNIEKLVLVGKLSDDDRNFIREMSCNRWEGGKEVTGSLKHLDMSELTDTVIYNGSFDNCRSLATVKLPKNIKILEEHAFAYCSEITNLIIPASITELGWGTLRACNGLKAIEFLGMKAPKISFYTFGEIQSSYCVVVPTGSKGYKTDENWNKMLNVYEKGSLPILVLQESSVDLYNINQSGVNEVQLNAYAIQSDGLVISDISWTSSDSSVAIVESNGYLRYVGAGNATITASVTNAGKTVTAECVVHATEVDDPDNAYYLTGNGNLRSLIGEDNKYNIEKLVLVGKLSDDDRNFIREMACNRWEGGQEVTGSLKYLDMDGLVDTILYEGAFSDCRSLETVILPEKNMKLENDVFAYCSNISSLIIPEGVTELGWGALRGCNGLKSIQFLGMKAPKISDYTFGEINSNYFVIVPTSSTGYRTNDHWKDMTNIYETEMLPMLITENSRIELYKNDDANANSEQLGIYAITIDGIKTTGISWTSSDTNIASVTGDGLVIAGAIEGDAIVTASYTENGKTVTSECKVSVVDISDYKYVYVANAGTLSELLSEEEILDTKKLAIAGNLNSNDIRVLRYMAGRDERGNLTVGSLEYLNMSKTRIVSGGEGYYYRDGWWRNVSDNHFGDDIFNSCNSLKKVVLPSTLKSMDSYTFYQCANLEEVVIPEGLTNIGHQAFYECRKLSKVNVPSSITNLSSWAFYGCTSLKSIDLSAMTSVSTIADNTFYESGLTRIQIPANITNIEYDAFRNTPLKRLEFENGSRLATIGDNAFYSTKLDSVIVPSSVTYIGNYAFNNCRQLSYVVYEENSKLNSLGRNVFDGCPIETIFIPRRLISMERQEFSESLKQIVVDEGNQFFEVYDDALCSKAEGSLIYVPKRKKSLYLPEYVTSLKDGVLQYHYDLQTVILSSQIRDLGNSPFYQCTNLKEIYCLNPVSPTARNLTNDFPYATVYIAKGSFDSYKDAGWDDYRITLVEQSFSNSINLATSEQILYNVEGGNKIKLEAKVFSVNGPVPNAPIDWITSDASVVTVDGRGIITYAGQGNAIITASVTMDGNIYSDSCVVNTKKFDDVDNVTIVIVETPGNLQNQISATDKKAITNLVVLGSINGTDIRFIREMARIPYASWEETPDGSLEYLDLSGATIVEGGGDYGYAEWQDELGRGYGDWPGTKTNVIGRSMFRNSPTLKTIILPNNVTSIELYAFRDCNKLESVVLPKNLSFIDNDAFNNCPSLSSFVIPESIDSLGANALRGFDAIYANSSTPVKILSYYLISEDAIVIVPADALQSYRAADNWKQFAGQIMPDNLNIQTVAVLDVTAEDEGSGLLTAAGGDDALAFIQDLTLRGTINSYDIMIIRNRMPRLHYLDLSDVRIVANPYEYYTDSHTENNRLGRNAFRELNKLREVILPRTIDYVGDGAFYHCENLTSVKIYNGVNTIDNYAFAECYNLVNVELPEGLLSIGYEAFRSCNRLENISIPSTVLSLGGNAFADCYNLKSVVLPKNLSVIEGSTFWYCENLESVVLPSKVYRIESHAFYHCPKLKELRLPPMIESIGDMAFYDCNNIKDVYVYIANSKDIRIDMKTFSCWTSAILHIPAFSYRSYFYDTQWSQFYSKVEFSDTYDEFYTKNTLELNSNTGVIDGDPNATLYEQGGLVVSDVEQVLDEVELKSDGTDGASLIATGSGNIKASKLTININVREYQWHFFCFPFDIPLDSIHYDGEYVWRQYDGLARSRREGGWQNLAEGTTKLSKGRGYIFQGTTTGSLSFTIDNPDLSAKDENTNLFTHESQDAQDANWNFIGNPYTSYYNIDETTYSAPITVWTGNGYEAYRPGDDEYRLAPYQAFFVQTPDDANEISFNADSRESYDRVQSTNRRTSSKRGVNQNRLFVELTVTADGESTYTDKTRIVFNNNKSLDYELNCDAAKFFSESRAIELYSIDSNGAIYSINERPTADSVVYLGIKVNVPGTYTIEAIRKDVPVILVDKDLNMVQDLMNGGYSFEAKAGESNRFILRICGDTPTNIINLLNDTERNDKLFDLQGREINDLNVKDIIILNGKKILNNY